MNGKFRAIHLLSGTEEERVARSIKEVSGLQQFGIEYKQINNKLYSELPPGETCRRPDAIRSTVLSPSEIGEDHWYDLSPRHYGCYSAHRNGVLDNFTEDLDAILVFECDAVCTIRLEDFYKRLCRLDDLCKAHPDIFIVQFGFKHAGKVVEKIEELDIIDQFIGTHAYLFPRASREKAFDLLENRLWDAMDMFYYHYCVTERKKIAIFNDRPVWIQADGKSCIQGWASSSEQTYRNWRYYQ